MISAFDALAAEDNQAGVTTNCKVFDGLFGGRGIPLGAVTEICGMAGLGKTQACMQLCASVQVPIQDGGVGGNSVYIDCEGSFVGSRMKEIALATTSSNFNTLSVESILQSISLIRPKNQADFVDCVKNLEKIVNETPMVKLVVIDSIAFFFRSCSGDYAERTRLLSLLAQNLRRVAQINRIAIVVTNQMTTKINTGLNSGGSLMVPALGESWGHACTHRIILLWQNRQRCAWLCKSSTRPDRLVPFQITQDGIRDVEDVESQ